MIAPEKIEPLNETETKELEDIEEKLDALLKSTRGDVSFTPTPNKRLLRAIARRYKDNGWIVSLTPSPDPPGQLLRIVHPKIAF